MIKDLFQIQNYKLFLSNMTMLGMAVAITTPFLVIFMTEVHGMSTTSYGIFMAAAAVGSFFVNTIIGRYSDRLKFDRKYLIIGSIHADYGICQLLNYSKYMDTDHFLYHILFTRRTSNAAALRISP